MLRQARRPSRLPRATCPLRASVNSYRIGSLPCAMVGKPATAPSPIAAWHPDRRGTVLMRWSPASHRSHRPQRRDTGSPVASSSVADCLSSQAFCYQLVDESHEKCKFVAFVTKKKNFLLQCLCTLASLPRNLDEIKVFLHEAGLPALRFHDLRHSAATILISMRVNSKVVQERLRHSTISITPGVSSGQSRKILIGMR